MRLNLKISQKGLLIFCIILVAELLFVWLYWNMSQSADAQIAEDRRVRQVISHLTKLSNLMQESTVGLLKALLAPNETAAYVAIIAKIPAEIGQLKELVRTPSELEPITRLSKTTSKAFPLFESALNIIRISG